MSAKLVEVVRLNGSRAGCHDRFSSRRPVGGEVFYLDSPFIEPTLRPPVGQLQNMVVDLQGIRSAVRLRHCFVSNPNRADEQI